MKTGLFALLMVIATSSFAQSISTIKGANIICKQQGGAVFINTKESRVWQGDVGEKEGLEFKIVRFDVSRCPNCYTIVGKLPGMAAKQAMLLEVVGTSNMSKANLTMSGIEGTQTFEIAKMACSVKKAK